MKRCAKVFIRSTLLIVVERTKYGMIEVGKTLPRIERQEGTKATTRLAKGFPTRRRMSE